MPAARDSGLFGMLLLMLLLLLQVLVQVLVLVLVLLLNGRPCNRARM